MLEGDGCFRGWRGCCRGGRRNDADEAAPTSPPQRDAVGRKLAMGMKRRRRRRQRWRQPQSHMHASASARMMVQTCADREGEGK